MYDRQGIHSTAVSWCKKGLLASEEINVLDMQLDACQCLYDAYKAMGNDNQALSYHERITVLNDSLQAAETEKKLQQMEFEKQMIADSLVHEKEKLTVQIVHNAEVRRKNRVRNIFIISAAFLLVGMAGLYWRIIFIRKSRDAIEKEKNRSEGLLLNILPAEIADELKEKGRADARKFEKMTISQSTYEYIMEDPAFSFQYRGKIHTKGKGEMEMWFVEKA